MVIADLLRTFVAQCPKNSLWKFFHKMISAALNLPEKQISNTLGLLAEEPLSPFISRYRKEITGGLDEVQIESIKTQYDKLSELAKRKETILRTIGEQGKLTPELRQRIDATWDATALEDIYLPYKPKRKTRAEAARQKGLEPLALLLMMQRENNLGPPYSCVRQRRCQRRRGRF